LQHEPIVWGALLACALASALAFAGLARGAWRGAWALTLLSAGSALWLTAAVLWPATWTDLSACYADAGSAWLLACAAIEALRHAGRFQPHDRATVSGTALLLVSVLWALALVVTGLPDGLRIGYRGLLVVDAAAAVVLMVVRAGIAYYRLEREPIADTALRWLVPYQVVRVVYIGLWEPLPGIAQHPVTIAVLSGLYVWSMLAIRDAALRFPPTRRARPFREATA
jgi:hypothetical protein